MNSENPIVLKKSWFHWTKSADEVICQVRIRTPQRAVAELMASLLINLRSVESLGSILLLAVEGLRDLPHLPFSEEWVKRIHISKKKATENEIGLKEYTLRLAHINCGTDNILWSSCLCRVCG